jgi:hypothetical protein
VCNEGTLSDIKNAMLTKDYDYDTYILSNREGTSEIHCTVSFSALIRSVAVLKVMYCKFHLLPNF